MTNKRLHILPLLVSALLLRPEHSIAQVGGQITFQTTTLSGDPVLWRIQADSGSSPENLTDKLDSISSLPGRHRGPIRVSPDGAWYVFLSERFDTSSQGWPGLTIARADLQSAETIRSSGQTIHGEGGQATAEGTFVVYVDGGGPHVRDLFVVQREMSGWSSPVCITTQSPYEWNYWPALRSDSAKVLFDAGPGSFPSEAICEVGLDGTGFRTLITKDDGPFGLSPSPSAHSPAMTSGGVLLFEAEWNGGERIWKLAPADTVPSPINPGFSNDNSPALLPDGRIVSLWLGSDSGNGLHEIKVMTPNGSQYYMLTSSSSPFPEVDDIGLGAGPSYSPVTIVKSPGPNPSFNLHQNFPNPFNPTTVISYSLPAAAFVRLAVFNMLGQEMALLIEEVQSEGLHFVRFGGNELPSGVYFYRLDTGRMLTTRKMLLVR